MGPSASSLVNRFFWTTTLVIFLFISFLCSFNKFRSNQMLLIDNWLFSFWKMKEGISVPLFCAYEWVFLEDSTSQVTIRVGSYLVWFKGRKKVRVGWEAAGYVMWILVAVRRLKKHSCTLWFASNENPASVHCTVKNDMSQVRPRHGSPCNNFLTQ